MHSGCEADSLLFTYTLGDSSLPSLLISELPPSSDGKAFRERPEHDVTGWSVWGSSVVLARFCCNARGAALLGGRRVLELGAGCGLAGLAAAARAGAASVALTDCNEHTLANLRENAARNADACLPCSLEVAAWDWDEAYPLSTPVEVVLGADLVYRRSYSRKLAQLLPSVVPPGGAFVLATPAQREGLPTLKAALAALCWALECEVEAPASWRESPLAGGGGDFPELVMRGYSMLVLVWRRPAEEG